MSPPKHTKFSDGWLGDGEFRNYLARDEKSDKSAKSESCNSKFKILHVPCPSSSAQNGFQIWIPRSKFTVILPNLVYSFISDIFYK